MLIYVLFFSLIVILITAFFLYKKDIMEPSIILVASYVLSVFCVLLNIEKWGINLSNSAFWILLLGTLEFILVSYIINVLFKKKNKNYEPIKEAITNVEVSKVLTVGIIIYNIIILILLIYNVLKIASCFGEYSTFSEALTIYKSHTSYAKDMQLPDYLTIIMKPIIASAYVYMFFFIKNIVYSEENKLKTMLKYWYYLVPTLTYFVQRLAESNRGSIINFILSAIVMYFITLNVKSNWKETIKLKTLIGLIISGILCLVLFYFSATIVGRVNTKGLLDYITCYCGGSIECFNLYVQEEDNIREIRGEETFRSTIIDLQKIGIIDKDLKVTSKSPFRYYKGNLIGNVYTSYKRWLHDYGIAGIVVLQAILAIIFSVAYNIIKYWKWSNKLRDLAIIIYSYFMYTIFMHPIDSLFYLETFTIYTCGVMLFILLVYGILIINKKNNIESKEYDLNNIKVLNITPALNVCGGMESYSMNYYRNMTSDIQIDFLTHEINDNDYKDEIENNGNKVFLLRPIKLKSIFSNIYEISKFFKENHNYDIIHCNMANAAVFYFYFAKKYNINIRILHSHNINYADKFFNKVRNIPLIFFGKKLATVNVACSKASGDFLFNKKMYYIINNAIDVEKYAYNEETRKIMKNKLKIKDTDTVIGTVGRLTEVKNHSFILEIMQNIINRDENYKLLIIGEGNLEDELKNKVKKLGIESNVIFTGSVNNVEDYLQVMDIFIMASINEGLGIVNIEAQASGLPSIVSTGIPQEAKITDLIKFIPLDKGLEYWSDNIVDLKINNNNRISYNEKVKLTDYNIKNQAKELENLYKNLLQEEYKERRICK